MEQQTLLGSIDPEIRARLVSRRAAMKQGAAWSSGILAGLRVASAPVALAALAKNAFAQGGLPSNLVGVLNFALLLEYLESEFYVQGVGATGLIPEDTHDVFDQIRKHEVAHVAFLRGVLGSQAIPKPREFDFTAGGGSGNGPFADVFTNYATFLAVSQAFEDTGVRAYKGAAPSLMENDQILTAALRIHSVEARHAAEVRRIRELDAWITGDTTDIPGTEPVYANEDNTEQGGVDVTAVADVSVERVTESFDEPLTIPEVWAIVTPFVVRLHCDASAAGLSAVCLKS